ncbi:MAG: hypothetical protein ACHQQ3_02615 [Gemmatimonadales bacterium]
MRQSGRAALLLTAVLVAPGMACDNTKAEKDAANAIAPVGAPPLDLAAKPQLLFQVFGERDDPRLLPLAAVVNGAIKPIGLTPRGWRDLDSLYFVTGAKYAIYHDDIEFGDVEVAAARPQMPLPGCRAMKPIAAAKLTFKEPRSDQTVEFIASSTGLTAHPPYKGSLPTEAEIAKLGRALGHSVGKQAAMDDAELDSLDFHARMILTGAGTEPTLLVSFIDPNGGDLGAGAGHTSHLFLLAEKSATSGAYEATYRHAVSGDAKTVEFQRVVDHLDVNGDGIDEIILEAWRYASEPDLVVLSFQAGRWHEVLRVKQSWCLDPSKAKK